MKILFIGGSNTILKKGISNTIPKSLIESGIAVEKVTNISIGGTSSLFAVENIMKAGTLNVTDVFIEFGINDLALYTNNKELWSYSYNTLLNLVIETSSKVNIYILLMGRSAEKKWDRQESLHNAIVELARTFSATIINIDKWLKENTKNSMEFKSLYRDEAHIDNERALKSIGVYVTSFVELNEAVRKNINIPVKPPKLNRPSLTSFGGTLKTFGNSRYNLQAVPLKLNDTISINVKGRPLGLSFISTLNSCSLSIKLDDEQEIIINTKMAKHIIDKYGFIIKHVPFYSLKNKKYNDNTKVSITCINSMSQAWSDNKVQYTYGLIKPERKDNVVYLGNLMHVDDIAIN